MRSYWIGFLSIAMGVWLLGCGKGGAKHFGEPFSAGVATPTISELMAEPDSFHRKTIRIKGQIERQCPASGCWVYLSEGGGESVRVELGDTLPNLPKRVGDTAEVEGELIPKGGSYEFIGTRITFYPAG